MSPSLLSQRLKELEAAGVIKRHPAASDKSNFEYQLTHAGKNLRSVVEAMGFWGQRWIETSSSLKKTEPRCLLAHVGHETQLESFAAAQEADSDKLSVS
jgi:DNA-binding HxlR family transcriptional regulator